MARHFEDEEEEEEPEEEEEMDEEEEEDEDYEDVGSSRKRKYKRSQFIDDVAEEDEDEEEDETPRKRKHRRASAFIDDTAVVASDEDEDEEEGEEDFINDAGAELQDEDDARIHRRPFLPRDDQEEQDVEDLERLIQQRYAARSDHVEYDEETTDVEQQALLPSVKDPKLWMVRCAIGHEREAAVCLMQKYLDLKSQGTDLHISSAIALDHLKSYLYIEADKEAHVLEACKGLRNIYSQKIKLVPIKEMTDVLSVESKSVDLSKDTWVRVKIGTYKGDLAKVMDVDNVRQRVTVKLVPRIDLQAMANKLEGKDVGKKKAFVPPPRFINMREVKDMRIPVERKRDSVTGEVFETIEGMMFKDGYVYKTVSMKSISSQNIQPSFDELQKFQKPGDDASGDVAGLSTLLANRKKGHFMKGDAVVVVRGDLKNLMGWVEKVEEDNIHIKPKEKGIQGTLTFKENELCKFFKAGDHVKVVSGNHQGATGMVVKVENHVLVLVSDTTKEDIRVFADNVVESSEITSGVTKLGDYELHDLVQLDHTSFGVIVRVESDGFQVLKGVPERAETVTVKLRDIRKKLFDRNFKAQDQYMNTVSLKDVIRILEGPFKGKQGSIEHMNRGVVFIHDRHHLENGGYICARAQSCVAVGGSRGGNERDNNGSLTSRFGSLRPPSGLMPSPRRPPRGGNPQYEGGGRNRGGRRHEDILIGRTIKIRLGPFKGYRGRVVDVHGQSVRIELESQMKIVTVNRDHLSDTATTATPARDSPRYGAGSETPMHPSRTPMHPYMTPIRGDPSATPIHDGMRTPMRDRAWNPLATMTPMRDNWEEGNPASWGAGTPQYQPGTPSSRPYEAPTPGSGWANTPGGNYSEAGTPRDSSPSYGNTPSPYLPSTPSTPSGPSYLPGTPGGQPMTPGNVGLDVMSPTIGGGQEGGLIPDIVVTLRRSGEDSQIAVVKDVLLDGTCKVSLGPSGNGEIITASFSEIEIILPKKSDKIKIVNGEYRGGTGKLIGIDGADGIVKIDDTLDIKILDMSNLAKLAS
ncbi:putative transcription elongation factor SPT5 homolog 1 [Cryptomeria japonica]|uniref:putative transcription elongation factor SPT5 homolog 1 n=1 Tax=Cryptomeria japonica TaxID=3369 RepID=UPI0025AB8873|nr:putative transcription elongation factor SPT5 homolog 1 [Cryptomeria japonica]XP_057873735.1 putative transcription elongation factor SPT5 homolog 1 [Cryptomeria japonica]XP_057873736.1 putative transcription elongation factor SPT5 homolog 1 [Cryptomeria japonica]XP_057873738.1 putative transcription elongation factor SPT5 homolog 1 [Cryptomeria japonica]